MKILDDYLRLEKEIFAYFECPSTFCRIKDFREMYWKVESNYLYYAEKVQDLQEQQDGYYETFLTRVCKRLVKGDYVMFVISLEEKISLEEEVFIFERERELR